MPLDAVRPVDSAGLLLIRQGPAGPEILLGRRRRSARAFPGAYVFPGGLMETADRRASGFREDVPLPPAGLDGRTRRGLRAFARTALRECYEETGLLLVSAKPCETASGGPGEAPVWRAYAEAGRAPAFEALLLTARAITPRNSQRRFHSRFFMAVLGPTAALLPGEDAAAMGGDGELEDLGWVRLRDSGKVPLADANAVVLDEVRPHLADHGIGTEGWPGRAAASPAPCFTWRGPEQHQFRTVVPHGPQAKRRRRDA